jgi:photosystem II stability/assembly factor-like uncharacterized protein
MKTFVYVLTLFLSIQAFGQSFCPTGQSLVESQILAGNTLPVADLDFISYNPFNPNEAWATGKSSALIKLTRTGGIWTATQQSTAFAQFANQRFKYIQFVSASRYILAGDGIGNAISDSGNLYVSNNSGATWSNQAKVPGGPNYFVLGHPSFSNWYIAGTRNGVFISKNFGFTWVRQNNITPSSIIGERYYAVVLDTSLSKVWVSNRAGYILSASIANFSPTGVDNPTWISEVTPTSTFSTIVNGNASFNHISKSGSTLVAVSDNADGAALIRSTNNGAQWDRVVINGYDPMLNGELRWSSIEGNALTVADDAGFVFYSSNINATSPAFFRVQANNGGDSVSTFTLNSVTLRLTPDIQFLTAGNIKQGGGGPILAHFGCSAVSGLEQEKEDLKALLYPNPSRGSAWFEAPFDGMVEVTDASGKVQHTQLVQPGSQRLSVEGLSGGLYQVRYVHAKGAKVVRWVVY